MSLIVIPSAKLCVEDPISVSRKFSQKFHDFFQTVILKGDVLVLLKCNKNKKMPSAAQWNILHHPSTYGTKIKGIQNCGHLCLGVLYYVLIAYNVVTSSI